MEVGHWETSLMFDCPDASKFSAHLNSEFTIFQAPTPLIGVELVEVTEKRVTGGQRPSAATDQERFSVVFRGPRDKPLEQGMYQMQHDQLGGFDLFLVPVGRDHDGVYYEAVFNRLRRQDA
jgi:hypothetical protein